MVFLLCLLVAASGDNLVDEQGGNSIVMMQTRRKDESTCPENYPICDTNDGNCLVAECSGEGIKCRWKMAEAASTAPDGVFNWIWGYDTEGHACKQSFGNVCRCVTVQDLSQNGYTCDDGSVGSCAADTVCAHAFLKGNEAQACQPKDMHMCPENFPVCDKSDGSCTTHECAESGCSWNQAKEEDQAPPEYNWISGYDFQGTKCELDFEAPQIEVVPPEVKNSGFEEGNTGKQFVHGFDVPNWETHGDVTLIQSGAPGFGNVKAADGSYFIGLKNPGSSVVQVVGNHIPGNPYTLTFSHGKPYNGGTYQPKLKVTIGPYAEQVFEASKTDFTEVTIPYTPDKSNVEITFLNVSPGTWRMAHIDAVKISPAE